MELDPQAVIDELSKRLHSLTLENVVLTTQLAQIAAQLSILDQISQTRNEPEEE